jgi:hypothetical protein
MRERLPPIRLRSKKTANGTGCNFVIVESFRDPVSRKPRHRQRLYWGKKQIIDLAKLIEAYNAAAKKSDKAAAEAVFTKITQLKIKLNGNLTKRPVTASVAIYNILDAAKTKITRSCQDADGWPGDTRHQTKKHLENAKRWIDELMSRL